MGGEIVDFDAVTSRARRASGASRSAGTTSAQLIRDFNQFAGSSPGEFARRRLPDGGGVVGD
jgi:hypothetical protein